MFSSLAVIGEVIPSLRVPWGMKIDFVGAIWVLAYFLYGVPEALAVSVISTIFMVGYDPGPIGFVGGPMKFIATVPMFLVPAALLRLPFFSERNSRVFKSVLVVSMAGFLAIVVRLIVTCLANYYWAVPLFLGMPTDVFMEKVFANSIWAFIVYVAGLNVLQGIVDIVVPWFLAFRLRLSDHFGTW